MQGNSFLFDHRKADVKDSSLKIRKWNHWCSCGTCSVNGEGRALPGLLGMLVGVRLPWIDSS